MPVPQSATHQWAEAPLWFPKPSMGWDPHLVVLPILAIAHASPIPLGSGTWSLKPCLAVSTAPLAPPRHLGFSDVSHDSARVSWEGTLRPVRLFRVSYVSSEGSHSGQVRAG